MEPGVEAVASLNPDLIIGSTHLQRETLAKFEQLKIPVLVVYGPSDFSGVYHTVRRIALALDRTAEGEAVVAAMRQRVEETLRRVEGLPSRRVYYALSFGESGDYTAGGDTFVHELLTLAGGENVAADIRGWAYSTEMVVEENPELIICSDEPGTRERLMNATGYRELDAVKAGRVYTIDTDLIDRQGPRLADGLEALARILHPEAFR